MELYVWLFLTLVPLAMVSFLFKLGDKIHAFDPNPDYWVWLFGRYWTRSSLTAQFLLFAMMFEVLAFLAFLIRTFWLAWL